MTLAISDFNPSEVEFNLFKPKTEGQKGARKSIYVNKAKGVREEVCLQFGETTAEGLLRAPFGISQPYKSEPGAAPPSSLNMELVVTDPVIKEKIEGLVGAAIDYMEENSMTVFGKVLSRATIEDRTTSPFKESTVEGKNHLLRVQVTDRSEYFCMHGVDDETKKLKCYKGTSADVQKNSRVAVCVSVNPICFIQQDKQIYLTMKASSVIVDVTTNKRRGESSPADFILPAGFEMTIDDAPAPDKKRKAENEPDEEPEPKRQDFADVIENALNPEAYLDGI